LPAPSLERQYFPQSWPPPDRHYLTAGSVGRHPAKQLISYAATRHTDFVNVLPVSRSKSLNAALYENATIRESL